MLEQFLKTVSQRVGKSGNILGGKLGMTSQDFMEVKNRIITKVAHQQLQDKPGATVEDIKKELRQYTLNSLLDHSEISYAYLKRAVEIMREGPNGEEISDEMIKDRILQCLVDSDKGDIVNSLEEEWLRLKRPDPTEQIVDEVVVHQLRSDERPMQNDESREKLMQYFSKLSELLSSDGSNFALNLGLSYVDITQSNNPYTIIDVREIALTEALKSSNENAFKRTILETLRNLHRNDLVYLLEKENDMKKWINIASSHVIEENFFRYICGFDKYEIALKMVKTKKSYSEINLKLLMLFYEKNCHLDDESLITSINNALSQIRHIRTLEEMNDFSRSLGLVSAHSVSSTDSNAHSVSSTGSNVSMSFFNQEESYADGINTFSC